MDLSAVIPGAQPILESDSEDSGDEGQEDVNSIQETIRNWMDETDHVLEFPATLSTSERRIVHLEAENLGLHHRSRGTGVDRRVMIQKRVAEAAASDLTSSEHQCHDDEVHVSTEETVMWRSKRARKHPEHLNDYV